MSHDLLHVTAQGSPAMPNPIGGQMSLQLSDEATGGHFSVHDNVLPAGSPGPRPHIHHHHDETFYVVSGELRVRAGERQVTALPGDFVVIPRGLVHQPSNPGTEPTRVLLLFSPGGMDSFFSQVAQGRYPLQGRPRTADEEARLMAFLAPYGYEFAELLPLA